MTVADAVTTRRSIRAFTDEPISLETLTRVMEQARWAPSGTTEAWLPWRPPVDRDAGILASPLERLAPKIGAVVDV
ncbi:hypothetical protein ASD54_21930 [Rhizobium sp. Root149]|nr:nitroreductase family protein [Rhizobium sp. Root149]KQZ46670.1 hypothetical protein ASD54_21930 [Rhizobium sp. Root149]